MAAMQGVVSKVSIKSTDADQFGNDKLKSFQVEGSDVWYGLGKSKGETINIKKGTGYQPLEAGDSVEFFYETTDRNGKTYYNTKSTKITITAKGAGGSAPAQQSAPKPQQQQAPAASAPARSAPAASGGSGNKAPYEAGIKVGHAINNAVQLCIADGKPVTAAALEAKAISILKLSKHLEAKFVEIMDGTYTGMPKQEQAAAPEAAPKATRKKPEPKPQPQPEPEPEQPVDDGPDVDDSPSDDGGAEPEQQQAPVSVMDFSDDIPF